MGRPADHAARLDRLLRRWPTPLAILLALARRSSIGGLRTLAIGYIEVMRATPMVAILYIAMLILPMALPEGLVLDKMYRAAIMITLFWAAYIAEVVRGGLQTVPPGQYEAATALGIGYWRSMQLVVLPQALRVVIPGMVNLAIGFLLATSLLAVIGVFDLLNAAKAAATDPQWLGFYRRILSVRRGDLFRSLPRGLALQPLAGKASQPLGKNLNNTILQSKLGDWNELFFQVTRCRLAGWRSVSRRPAPRSSSRRRSTPKAACSATSSLPC